MSGDIVGADFTGWAIEALIASTILMVFVLLARKEAQRALGTQLAYWLWALPALRMAMPPIPASWRDSAAAPLSAASETVMILVQPILPATTATEADAFPWVALIAGAWVLGALVFFVWHSLAHFSYVRRIVAPPAARRQLPDGTTLVESEEAIGPVAFGVLKRFVAVPTDFAERYDADERKLALAHELGHHARGDLIANWIALAMLACHWFNPIAWIAYRKFRADQEMANDARVLSALPPIERHAYACAIVKAAHGRAVTAACHLHTIEDLKGRLRMLKASRKSRRVLMAGAIGIASLTVAGLGLTASGAAAEKIRTVAETQVVAITQTTAPTPPVAAVPPVAKADDSAPGADRKRKVVIVKDGKTETYEGADADAFIASHPAVDQPRGKWTNRHRIVISRNGQTTIYQGADADAYLKAHPELQAPLPPPPPSPRAGFTPPKPPVAGAMVGPVPPSPVIMVKNRDGKTMRMVQAGPGATMTVVEGDCGPGNPREFVNSRESKDGPRMVICTKRIERYAADQARSAANQQRIAALNSQAGLRSGLAGLETGRRAILNAPGMTDDQRKQALAGIDQARAEMLREMQSGKSGD